MSSCGELTLTMSATPASAANVNNPLPESNPMVASMVLASSNSIPCPFIGRTRLLCLRELRRASEQNASLSEINQWKEFMVRVLAE